MGHQLVPLIIETDSMLMKQLIDAEWKIPWNVSMEVKKIKEWMRYGNIQISHTLKEGNQVADFSANVFFCFAGTCQYNNF